MAENILDVNEELSEELLVDSVAFFVKDPRFCAENCSVQNKAIRTR